MMLDMDGNVVHEGSLTSILTNWRSIHNVLRRYCESSGKVVYKHGCCVMGVRNTGDNEVGGEFEENGGMKYMGCRHCRWFEFEGT